MNRSLVAGSRQWEKLERPGNEAGIFDLPKSFTEQPVRSRLRFKESRQKCASKRGKKIGQYPAMLSPRAYLITHSS